MELGTLSATALYFGDMESNAKLAELLKTLELDFGYTFSIPAGWSCPSALECLSRAHRDTGKITDGPQTRFRCFAATIEARSPAARDHGWENWDLLLEVKRDPDAMAALILAALPIDAEIVRIHVRGDFWSREYLDAWLLVAAARPSVRFYAYTKSFDILPPRASLPANLAITASEGGKHPMSMATDLGYFPATVVFSEAQAEAMGLAIDHDDSHALAGDHAFALLLHGTQPKGSEAAAALRDIKAAAKAPLQIAA